MDSPNLKKLDARANQAAMRVSRLIVALEKAQAAYKSAHEEAQRYRELLASKAIERA